MVLRFRSPRGMRGVCLPGTPAARSRHGLPAGRLPACVRSGVSPRDPVAESQSSFPMPLFLGGISPRGQLLFLGELAWFLAKLLAVTSCVFTQAVPALASVRTFVFSPRLSDGTICRDVVSLVCPVPGAGGRHTAWASGLHGPRAKLGRGSCGVCGLCPRSRLHTCACGLPCVCPGLTADRPVFSLAGSDLLLTPAHAPSVEP